MYGILIITFQKPKLKDEAYECLEVWEIIGRGQETHPFPIFRESKGRRPRFNLIYLFINSKVNIKYCCK